MSQNPEMEAEVLSEESKQEQIEKTELQEETPETVEAPAAEVTEETAEETAEEAAEEATEEAAEEAAAEDVEMPAVEAPVVEEPAEEAAEEPVIEAPQEAAAPAVKQPKPKKIKKSRSLPVKILMAFLATILCLVMFVVSFTGILVLNVRTVLSRDGITKIVNQLVSGSSVSAPVRPALAAGAGTMYLDEASNAQSDMSNMLVDWAYEVIQEAFGDEVELTKEQVQTFVAESTVKDFVADKAAGLVEDFYAEESNTVITAQEITQLMQENKEILEEQFGVVVDQAALDEMDVRLQESGVLEPIEEKGLMGYIEETLAGESDENDFGEAKEALEDVKEAMSIVRLATSYKAVLLLVGMFLLIMVLLIFITSGVPAALSQSGSMLLSAGMIFAIPTALCMFAPELITGILGENIGGILCLVFNAAATVNFAAVGIGFGLIVIAIVAKIIKGVRRAKALIAG